MENEKSPSVMPDDVVDQFEFKKWFGTSKVVNNEGQALVVFHGTSHDFKDFDATKQGSTFENVNVVVPADGFWFTDSVSNADWYSSVSARSKDGSGRQTLPVYLALNNPFFYSAEMYATEGAFGIPSQYELEESGHDGIIAQVADYPEEVPEAEAFREKMGEKYQSIAPYAWSKAESDHYGTLLDVAPVIKHTHYVAFQPEQIKSAFYVLEKEVVLDQTRKGCFSGEILSIEDGMAKQRVNRDGSTVLHSLSALSEPVNIGSVVDINYSNGVGVVRGKGASLSVCR